MSTTTRQYGWLIGGAVAGLTIAGVFAGPIAAQVKAALVRNVENPDTQEIFHDPLIGEIPVGHL